MALSRPASEAGVPVGAQPPRTLAVGPRGPELGPVWPRVQSLLGNYGEVQVRGAGLTADGALPALGLSWGGEACRPLTATPFALSRVMGRTGRG